MPSWKKADMAAAKDAKAEAESGTIKFLKVKGGQRGFIATRLRIAPPHVNMPTWFVAVPMHFNVGPQGKQRSFGCAKRAFNAECPVCEAAAFLKEGGQEEQAKMLWPTTNYMMNVFVVEEQDGKEVIEDPTCYVWSVRQGVFGQVWDEFEPDNAGNLTVDLTDVEDGFTLVLKRKGTGKTDTEYKVSCESESGPFPADHEILEGIYDLTQVTQYLTPEDAMAVLTGNATAAGPALASGDPWKAQALPPGQVVEGEAHEVPEEAPAEEPAEEPAEDDEALKRQAEELAAAAVAQQQSSAKKGKKGKKASPAEEEPAEEPAEEPKAETAESSESLDGLKAFLDKKKAEAEG